MFYRSAIHTDSNAAQEFNKELVEVHPLDANLISSEKANGRHVLMLDLDQSSFIVPSSTEGHNHVYIDADLTLEALEEIVDVLVRHGILQNGIKKQVSVGKCLTLRPPGIKKDIYNDNADLAEYKKNLESEEKKSQGPTPQLNSEKEKFAKFKSMLSNKPSTDWKLENTIKEGVYRISVSQEVLWEFATTICVKLGLDSAKIAITTGENMYLTLQGGKSGKISYEHNKMADLYYSPMTDTYMVEFRKEFFLGHPLGGIPKNWPSWENVVKSVPII